LYVVRECIPCIVSIIIVSWCGLWLFQWTTFQQHQTHWTHTDTRSHIKFYKVIHSTHWSKYHRILPVVCF